MKTPLDIIEETYVEAALSRPTAVPIRDGIIAMANELRKPGQSAEVKTNATIFITQALALLLAHLPNEESRKLLLEKITEMAMKEAQFLSEGIIISSEIINNGEEELCSKMIKIVMGGRT